VLDLTMQADVIVEDNDIGYQGDDSVAVSPSIFSVAGVSSDQVSVVGYCDPDPMDVPIPGDALAFFDANFLYKAQRYASRLRTTAFAARRFLRSTIPSPGSTRRIRWWI
jgi:hypothetical protein